MISYLVSDPAFGAVQFVPAASPPSQITINDPGPPAGNYFGEINAFNAWGRRRFQAGEFIEIESAQIMLPYQFGIGLTPAIFTLEPLATGGQAATLPTLHLPDTCEHDWNQTFEYIAQAPPFVGDFDLQIATFFCSISMENVPTELIGDALHMNLKLRIRHTLPLVAVP